MVQDGIVCDGVGWWSGLNKGGDGIYDVDMVLGDIVEVMGTNNTVPPPHGASIGYSIIGVDGRRIP